MSIQCAKLSPLIPMGDGQALRIYLNELYPIYYDEIASKQFYFHGKPIVVFTDLNCDLRHETFEHLTTKGSNERSYNFKRCERILWIRDILSDICENCDDYRVLYDSKWKSRAGAKRYIIWCVKEDYAIVLEERQNEVFLITAYCVLYANKRRDFAILYNESQNTKTPTT